MDTQRGRGVDEAVATFRELLNPIRGEEPGEAQRRAARLLPERLMRSPMDWWPIDAVPHGPGNRLLIGVAVWSGYDLKLLDALEEAIRDGRGSGILVGVFDIDRLESPSDIERLIPGVGSVSHTPVVGYWVAGKLAEHGTGYPGRQLVCRLFGLDHNTIVQRAAATPQ